MTDESKPPDDQIAAPMPRRFKNAGDASKEVYDSFNDWTSGLATYGVQAIYALIAANWALHGAANKITTNPWAKASIVIAIAFLGGHLVIVWAMTLLHKRRIEYIDADKARWMQEFAANRDAPSSWPYTLLIEVLGELKRWLLLIAPLLSGVCLIFSVFP